MAELVVEHLTKRFGAVTAVDDVSLAVKSGELVSLLGPSGCGKTTTLMCIAGLQRPDKGRILAGAETLADAERRLFLPPERRQLGMVFQSYALWPHMTVTENVAYGLRTRRVPESQIRDLVNEVLRLVQLEGMGDRYPHQLSGGQQQRVALARALVYRPRMLLLDEPLSNLDAKLREHARVWLRGLQQRLGITTIYVTHDQVEALSLSDRIAVMAGGRIVQVGRPHEIYERPADRFVADFIGQASFLPGQVVGHDGEEVRVRLASGHELRVRSVQPWSLGQAVLVAVRPERVVVADTQTENVLPGAVRAHMYLGARYLCLVDVGGLEVRLEVPSELPRGQVRLYVAPHAAILLPYGPA